MHTVAEARVIWHAHHPEHSGLAGPSESAWYASLSLGFGEAPGTVTRKKPANAASGAPRPGLPLALATQWLARRPLPGRGRSELPSR